MSKLAHSHQPTMDEIEARHIAECHAEMDEEANAWAREFLMPEDQMRAAISYMGGIDICDERAVKRLADRFRVPATVMAIRIGELMERSANIGKNNSEKGQEVAQNGEQNPDNAGTPHSPDCAYHLDQYGWECDCVGRRAAPPLPPERLLTMDLLDTLEDAARKATPGPYTHFAGSRGVYAVRPSPRADTAIATMAKGNRYGERVSAKDNGAYFTACSPEVILALVQVARAAEAEWAQWYDKPKVSELDKALAALKDLVP